MCFLVRYYYVECTDFTYDSIKILDILSPVLVTVYIDNLLKNLKQRNIGCKIDNRNLAEFGYADDLTFLCLSLTRLKEMLNTCENYAKDYNILLNVKKNILCILVKYYQC